MRVKEYLKLCLINYPSIFSNALDVYIHWFSTLGNGLEWRNGEIYDGDYASLSKDEFDAAKTYLDSLKNTLKFDIKINEKVRLSMIEDVAEKIKRILMADTSLDDFSINDNTAFYELSKYSLICNLPDDIKYDWLEAAETFYNIMLENVDKISDEDNLLPEIGKRIKHLKIGETCNYDNDDNDSNNDSNVEYRYIVVSYGDSDFFSVLDDLGNIVVRTMGRYEFNKLITAIPKLFIALSPVCMYHSPDEDYVYRHLKVFCTIDSIIKYIKEYCYNAKDYSNVIIEKDDRFTDVVHYQGYSESLIIRLAYKKDTDKYLESKSDWLVF